MTGIAKDKQTQVIVQTSRYTVLEYQPGDDTARTCVSAVSFPSNCIGIFITTTHVNGSDLVYFYPRGGSNTLSLVDSAGMTFLPTNRDGQDNTTIKLALLTGADRVCIYAWAHLIEGVADN